MTTVSRTLRLKVSLGVGLTLILLLAPLNWAQYELQQRGTLRELELLAAATGSFVVQSLENAMLTNDRREVQVIVDNVVDTPEILSVYILSPTGEVAASPSGLHNGEKLTQRAENCQVCHRLPLEVRPRGVVTEDIGGQPIFRTMTPIINRASCHECHSPEASINGVFYMDFSMIGLNARLDQARRTAFWGSMAIIAVCTAAIYALLSWLLITPLERIVQEMRRFGQGQRSARVTVSTRDEVGLVAATFNEMATTIEQQEAESERLYSELESHDLGRRRLLARLITAREEERQRLARRIHDVLGQLLTGASLQLKYCEDAVPEHLETLKTHFGRARAVMRETIDQAHDLIMELRPSVLDDYGLIPALEEEVKKRLTPLGIETRIRWAGDIEQLSEDRQTATFRIAQEAFTNIVRHANAKTVRIEVSNGANEMLVTIEDDGVGFAPHAVPTSPGNTYRGTGITGMQERAAAIGGRLEVVALQPHGTRILLTVPLEEKRAA